MSAIDQSPDPTPTPTPGAATSVTRGPLFSYRRTMWLTVTLLVAVSATALLQVTGALERVAPADQYAIRAACGMLVGLAITVLLIGRYMTQRSFQQVEQQLQRLAEDDHGVETFHAPAADDLRPVMAALADYVGSVRLRVDHLPLLDRPPQRTVGQLPPLPRVPARAE